MLHSRIVIKLESLATGASDQFQLDAAAIPGSVSPPPLRTLRLSSFLPSSITQANFSPSISVHDGVRFIVVSNQRAESLGMSI